MTHAHPNLLAAFADLADLVDQQQWLAGLLEPGTKRPARSTARLTPAARAIRNRQTRAERADQVETARQGLAPRGASPAPVVVDVLDAQMDAVYTVMHAAWRVTDALATLPDAPRYCGGGGSDDARFSVAAGYLEQTLPLVHPDLAGELGRALHDTAKLCERASGRAPLRHDLATACPACGDRFLTVTTWGTDDAVVTCRCKCHGIDCLCKRPGRLPGARHIWQAAEFDQLKKVLRRGEAA